jgi:hypothetical protein
MGQPPVLRVPAADIALVSARYGGEYSRPDRGVVKIADHASCVDSRESHASLTGCFPLAFKDMEALFSGLCSPKSATETELGAMETASPGLPSTPRVLEALGG